MLRVTDTIYALSSGASPSGVAIIRASGPSVPELARMLCGGLPEPRRATLRSLRNRDGLVIDNALVLYFSGPNSFTGEDCLEFQVHGGRAVVAAVLDALAAAPATRHALAGEFSRRAFDNGKLDLVEIEGLADLISADTEMQRRLAIEHANGGQSKMFEDWARRITRARALLEAELDFSEEEDVPGSVSHLIWPEIAAIAHDISAFAARNKTAEIIRDGYQVVIAGRPNAGKSSLLNALAHRDIAIVSDIPGTTRDTLSVDLNIGGFLVRVTDTAGLRVSQDVIEAEGVRRAYARIAEADMVIALQDPFDSEPFSIEAIGVDVVKVWSKSDLRNAGIEPRDHELAISVRSGKGFDSLTKRILESIASKTGSASASMPTRRRQVDLLLNTERFLLKALESRDIGLELTAEHLRQAAHALGKLTGRVDVEDLLDVIFSEFCIGK